MTRKEFYEALTLRIPTSLSADWDHDGLHVCADLSHPVKRILCVLDVTDDAISHAAQNGFDLILSHHPLIFRPLDAITEQGLVSSRVLNLLKADIAAFSFHTRLDSVEGGINDALCAMLGIVDVKRMGEGEAALGRVGRLPHPLSITEFAAHVKRVFDVPAVNMAVRAETVSTVAVVGGGGGSLIGDAARVADTYLSGDMGYHAMVDASINLVEIGHYYSERHAADLLSQMAKDICPDVMTEIYTPVPIQFYQ